MKFCKRTCKRIAGIKHKKVPVDFRRSDICVLFLHPLRTYYIYFICGSRNTVLTNRIYPFKTHSQILSIFNNTHHQPGIRMKKQFVLFVLLLVAGGMVSAQKTDTLTTASGLKYFLTKKGSGRLLQPGEVAVWHYSLALPDGTKIDDTRDRNSPLGEKIPSARMIKGTSEALLLMRVGDRGMFIFPPALAYGQRGSNGGGVFPNIPPNTELLFDMELIDIKKGALLDTLEKTLYTTPLRDTSTPRVAEVIALYKELKKKNNFGDLFTSDNDLNTISYLVLEKNPQEAIKIFLLNVQEYPKVGNVYDSLAEGYMVTSDFDKAIQYYEKALEIDPKNTNATEKIKQMKAKRAKAVQQMD